MKARRIRFALSVSVLIVLLALCAPFVVAAGNTILINPGADTTEMDGVVEPTALLKTALMIEGPSPSEADAYMAEMPSRMVTAGLLLAVSGVSLAILFALLAERKSKPL